MSFPIEEATIVSILISIPIDKHTQFIEWQAKLHAAIALFTGFISLEFLSSNPATNEWLIVQRFDCSQNMLCWRQSEERKALLSELEQIAGPHKLQESSSNMDQVKAGVTEVFVTHVSPNKVHAYREWIAKVHRVEAQFPGFRGVYVQSPSKNQKSWITLLQFDTPENLDRWLSSSERKQMLIESKSLIDSLEDHRMVSSFAGWFSSVAKGAEIPPVWKQTMLVLLVLFPIVMLELKFLSPLTQNWKLSAATFIGNAISVTLVSWPLMPIVIRLLDWWLIPSSKTSLSTSVKGALLIGILYLIEIGIFWELF